MRQRPNAIGYPKEYYLKTTLSEYYKTLGNRAECMAYAI